MIIEATYKGRHPFVKVPGFAHKFCAQGETVKLRIQNGTRIGSMWEIVSGEEAYQKAVDAELKLNKAKLKAKNEAKKEQTKKIEAILDMAIKEPKPDKKDGK